MLPPKCISCGKFLADIQLSFEQSKILIDSNKKLSEEEKKIKKKELLNSLYVIRWCCRAQVITYVDTINIII